MLITIETYTIAMDAYITKGRLEAEGIPATIADEHYITLDWTVSVALGGVRVQVPVAYVKQAKHVIKRIELGEYEVSSLSDEELLEEVNTHCPKCNSKDIYSVNIFWKLSLIILFLAHLPFPFSRHVYKCKSGHSWIDQEEQGHPIYIIIFAVLIDFLVIFILLYFLHSQNCHSFFA